MSSSWAIVVCVHLYYLDVSYKLLLSKFESILCHDKAPGKSSEAGKIWYLEFSFSFQSYGQKSEDHGRLCASYSALVSLSSTDLKTLKPCLGVVVAFRSA